MTNRKAPPMQLPPIALEVLETEVWQRFPTATAAAVTGDADWPRQTDRITAAYGNDLVDICDALYYAGLKTRRGEITPPATVSGSARWLHDQLHACMPDLKDNE